MESLGSLIFILRKKGRQFRDHVHRLIKRCPPNMRIIGAEFNADESEAPFVDPRMVGVDHVTLALRRRPLRWSILVLQIIHTPHDHLLRLVVFLHERDPVEVVLMLGGKHLRAIDAVELLHSTVRGRNRLLAVF